MRVRLTYDATQALRTYTSYLHLAPPSSTSRFRSPRIFSLPTHTLLSDSCFSITISLSREGPMAFEIHPPACHRALERNRSLTCPPFHSPTYTTVVVYPVSDWHKYHKNESSFTGAIVTRVHSWDVNHELKPLHGKSFISAVSSSLKIILENISRRLSGSLTKFTTKGMFLVARIVGGNSYWNPA